MQATRCLGLAAVRQLRRRGVSLRLEWRRSAGICNSSSRNNTSSDVNAAADDSQFETKREGEGWRQLRRPGRRQQPGQQTTAAGSARDGVETLTDDYSEDSEPASSLQPPVERCQGCGVVLQSAHSDAPGK